MRFRHPSWLLLPLLTLVVLVPASLRAADADPATPGDTELIASVNLKQILDSALVKKYLLDQFKGALQTPDIKKFTDLTGLDPLSDLHSVTLSAVGTHNPKFLGVVRGKFDVDRINKAAAKAAEEDPSVKITKAGDQTIVEATKGKDTVYTLVADAKTLLFSNDKDYLLKGAKRGGQAVLKADLKAAMGKVAVKDSLWFVVLITDEIKQQIAKNPQTEKYAEKLKSVTASVNLTDAVAANLQIHTTDVKVAMDIKSIFEGLKPLAALAAQGDEQKGALIKEVMDNVKIEANESTVKIEVKVSEELIKKLQEAAKRQ
jgi:hypothetical protein